MAFAAADEATLQKPTSPAGEQSMSFSEMNSRRRADLSKMRRQVVVENVGSFGQMRENIIGQKLGIDLDEQQWHE